MLRVVAFYGADKPNGEFSNFYPAPFVVGTTTFKHTEQFIMYKKAVFFRDWITAEKILETEKPLDCKRLGRTVTPFNEVIWEQRCEELVFPGMLAKFEQNEHCRNLLLSTGDDVLAECAPRDVIWGIGLASTDPRHQHPSQWRGKNRQGNLLMKVRGELRSRGYSAEYVER